VVIKTRQHLAAIKPQKNGLMLELMHFPEELIDAAEFKQPAKKSLTKPELSMALQLIESMTTRWTPETYQNDYREALEKVIQEKIESGGELPKGRRPSKPKSNVIDLVAILQKSLDQAKPKPRAAPSRRSNPRRKAA
jgi:DNA end-binding protein Ku